jgi:hypothetical protein
MCTILAAQTPIAANPIVQNTIPHAAPHDDQKIPVTVDVSAAILRDGLHVNAVLTNLSVSSTVLDFPTSARIDFRAYHGDCVVWDSNAGVNIENSRGHMILEALETKSFSAFWRDAAVVGRGSVNIVAQLLTDSPITSPPEVIVGITQLASPAPSGGPSAPTLPSSMATLMPMPAGSMLPGAACDATAEPHLSLPITPRPGTRPAQSS